jgi:hypothetical protein
MRNATLALTSFLLAGACFAQQATPAKPATPATAPSGTAVRPMSPQMMAPSAPEPLPNALTDDQAKQMLDVTGASGLKEELKEQMLNYFHTNMPFMPKDVSDDLEQSFEKADVDTPIVAIYKAHITAADADAIIAFYKTPAGKDMMKTLPVILQQSQQAAVQIGRRTAQGVIERHRPEIEAAAKQYREEHMPKPAPSLNTPAAPGTSGTPAKPGTATTPAPKPPQ